MMTFCTLFDSFYLDKAIALYNSLEKVTKNFCIYVFCFDDKSYNVMNSLNFPHATVLSHTVIENEQLRKLKMQRSKAEYCWTCTPIIIEYVLKNFRVLDCTYIDADLYFFKDPQPLFDEIRSTSSDVSIVEHRFKKDKKYFRNLYRAGKYCVEFNYFKQSENAINILTWWKNQCLEWCFYKIEPTRMGDQKYLEQFPKLFKGVHELQYLGGGVAPWNLNQYKLCSDKDGIILIEKTSGIRFDLIFYHFQNLRYLSNNIVNLKSQTSDKKLKYAIYLPYLIELRKAEKILSLKFNIILERRKKYSNNWFNTILQRYIVALKIKSISDVINLNNLKI